MWGHQRCHIALEVYGISQGVAPPLCFLAFTWVIASCVRHSSWRATEAICCFDQTRSSRNKECSIQKWAPKPCPATRSTLWKINTEMTSRLASVVQRNHHSIVQISHPGPITAPELVENFRRSELISKHECYEFAHGFTFRRSFLTWQLDNWGFFPTGRMRTFWLWACQAFD